MQGVEKFPSEGREKRSEGKVQSEKPAPGRYEREKTFPTRRNVLLNTRGGEAKSARGREKADRLAYARLNTTPSR